jgi:SsrA-binding protein
MVKIIAENRRALHDFEIEEKFEAGIRLTGAEMKSVRQRRVDLRGSFVKIINEGPFVLNLKIHKYPFAADREYDPKRTRKLLLKKNQIKRLIGKDSQKGTMVVPLRLYLKGNVVKLEIGVGKMRKKWDKRQVLKERDDQRQTERSLKESTASYH